MASRLDPCALRVVTQYWKGRVRICEMESSGVPLDIHVSRAETGEWRIEAHDRHSADATIVVASGATSAAALVALAGSWNAQAPLDGLHAFNWDDVTRVLQTIRIVE